jgi:hypothetical protein
MRIVGNGEWGAGRQVPPKYGQPWQVSGVVTPHSGQLSIGAICTNFCPFFGLPPARPRRHRMDRNKLRHTGALHSDEPAPAPHNPVTELLATTVHGVVAHIEIERGEESDPPTVRRTDLRRPRLSCGIWGERIAPHETTASRVFLRPNHANLTTATNIQMAHASP